MIKKTWLIILVLTSTPIYALEIETNPYHNDWSCHTIKNDSDYDSPNKPIWACTQKPSKNIAKIFDKKQSKSNKQQLLIESLGWIPDTSDTNNTCNSCKGYYYQYPFADKNIPLSESKSNIEFSKLSENIKTHQLHYQGNVVIKQPSRVLYTDDALVTYNPDTNKPSTISASGNVKLIQPGEMIMAENGKADLYAHKTVANNAIYLFNVPSNWLLKEQFEDKNFTGFAHGTSTKITQKSEDLYTLENATYTTCPPTTNTWKIKAKTIDLNKKTNQGVAKHTVVRVLGVPVFYFPYFSFPLGPDRKTGLLYPSFSYNTHNGAIASLPYYLNLAPNYDDTITPTYYEKNGLMLYNQFRFLSKKASLENNIYYMPRDSQTHTDRYFGDIKINSNFTNKLSGDILYQNVSDQNYFADFDNSNPENANRVLLDRHAQLNYHSTHWDATAFASNYKTVNDQLDPDNRPYDSLPSLTLNYDTISTINGLGFNINNNLTNFHKNSKNKGFRVYSTPDISWGLDKNEGFVKANIIGNAKSYNNITINNKPNIPHSKALFIPQYQIIEGLNFIKSFSYKNNEYKQTLTPKIGYLYTPYRNQDNLPIFDGGVIGFSYDQLFATNSFSGHDRIQNANQISYAITSSITSEGKPKLDVGAGQIYYFTNRKVSMTNDSSNILQQLPESQYKFSDLASNITYHFNDQITFNLNSTYDFNHNDISSVSESLQYNLDPKHILNLQYRTTRFDYSTLSNEDIINGNKPNRNSQIIPSFIWELNPSWIIIGKFNYSLNLHKTIDTFAGIAYDSCCWYSSFGVRRFLDQQDPNQPNQYTGRFNNSFMIQFELKGLGSLATNQITDMVSAIPGYMPYESGFR